MTELLTAAQMRDFEQAAMTSGAVTGLELMERAGTGVVDAVLEAWPDLAIGTHRAVVLCGPGNNGGDGFVVARLLSEKGWAVQVFLYGDPGKLPSDARTNCERWREVGDVTVRAINPPPLVEDSINIPEPFDLLVDGLFGTGLIRPFGGPFTVFAQIRDLLRDRGVRVVAVDIPTGLCSDSGRVLGTTIAADLTVTFHSAKVGHMLAEGPTLCGEVHVHDIGLPEARQEPADAERVADRPARMASPAQLTKQPGNKFDHGHALILSGAAGRTGAARLAARGALRIGAGLVTLGVPPSAQMEVANHITALMMKRVGDAEQLNRVLDDARINAVCLGPGLGLDERAASLMKSAVDRLHTNGEQTGVFDADALTVIAQNPDWMTSLDERAILTPHGGEFQRLFPDLAERLRAEPTQGPAFSKVDATREAAVRCGAIVLFKGPDTVIAHPDGRCAIHTAAWNRRTPWLATAGAGDVLAGFITGLLARGFEPMRAAEKAAWLHVECALAFGPGLIAEDLPEMVPQVLRALEP